MGGLAGTRLAIALAGLLLLAGVLLIVEAGALLSVDRSVLAPAQDIYGKEATRPVAALPDPQRRESARKIAPDLIAPPALDVSEIERIEPRPPLGELGLAVAPETQSASFESAGRKVIISGVMGIDPGTDLFVLRRRLALRPTRARAAFNSWLRGRASTCLMPPEIHRFAVAAPCKLGRQDVGAWLVSNGWAQSLPGGIYGKAETTARHAEMGIFGPPR